MRLWPALLIAIAGYAGLVRSFADEQLTGAIVITAPAGAATSEVEVLSLAAGEGGAVLARLRPPGQIPLSPGAYAVRLTGTDYRYGPVIVSSGASTRLDLAALAIERPPDTFPADQFLLDQASGALAARISDTATPVITMPGRFWLRRDESETGSEIALAPGEMKRVQLAGLRVHVIGEAAPTLLFLRTSDQRTAGVTQVPGPPFAVSAGQYFAVLADSAFELPVDLRPGRTLVIPAATFLVQSVGEGSRGYSAVDVETRRVLVQAKTSPIPRLLIGTGRQMVILGEPYSGDVAKRVESAPRFIASAGKGLRIWMSEDGKALVGGGDLSVDVVGAEDGAIVVDRRIVLKVPLAESVRLTASAYVVADNHAVHSLPAVIAHPPFAELAFAGGSVEVTDGTPIYFRVDMDLPDGSRLQGVSPVVVARHVALEPPRDVTAVAESPTRVAIQWKGEWGARYNLYRTPSGLRAINGSVPLGESQYVDRALTARRQYTYLVCVVDDRALEGRCGPAVTVSTPGPGG
jgi:hypothetical protein